MSLYNNQTGEPWYTSHNAFKKVFDRMEELPKQYQIVVAKYINEHIRVNHYLAEERRDLKSLGAQTVLHLYSSRNKSFWFSDDSELSQAINSIVYLRKERRNRLVYLIKLCVESVHQYLGSSNDPANVHDAIEAIAKRLFEYSLDELETVLKPMVGNQQTAQG